MKYRNLANSEIKVSEIALGCEGFTNKTLEETKELLKYCFDNGINFIDFYTSNPELRSNFGEALKELEKILLLKDICVQRGEMDNMKELVSLKVHQKKKKIMEQYLLNFQEII